MKILITGANGFVGQNLTAELRERGFDEIDLYDLDSDPDLLGGYTKECDFVFHLAGVNRTLDEFEFDVGNRIFTAELLGMLRQHGNSCPVVVTSSFQAECDNPFGMSKGAAEVEALSHALKCGARVMVYRLPNLFGKWARPNYNSLTATLCHNIARDLDVKLSPDNPELTLCYIDDLVAEFMLAMEGREHRHDNGFCYVPVTHKVRLFDMAKLLRSFEESRHDMQIPELKDAFTRKLYNTYVSYLPPEHNKYSRV